MWFGPNFLHFRDILHQAPTAQTSVNNYRSEDFLPKTGTRQSCPLSLISFTISLEPLDNSIWQNNDITGNQINGTENKLLYASLHTT